MKAIAVMGLLLGALVAPGLAGAQDAPPPTVFSPTSPLDRELDWRALDGEPPRPAVITNPNWLRMPSQADMIAAMPEAARKSGTDGSATIQCKVTDEGGLSACSVVTEFPAGEGFGEAAIGLSPIFRMRPTTPDGAKVGGAAVRVPLRFITP